MDQNYNGNGMIFGGDNSFFPFDPAALDHLPSGQTILNDTEDDYLSTFFDNPNMAQQIDPFENMFSLGGKSLSQGTSSATSAGFNNNNNLDASAPLDPSQPPYQPAPHINSMPGSQQQSQQQPSFGGHAGFLADSSSISQTQTETQTMNNADMSAASSLFGFAHKTPHMHNWSPTTDGNQLAGSWGNLVVGNSNMPGGSSSGSFANTSNEAARARVPSLSRNSHVWSGNSDASHGSSAQHAGDSSGRYLDQPNLFAQPPTNTTQQRPFPGVDFGSDPNFSSKHYLGPQYNKDKAGNLLNVPLADKVRVPYGPHAMANQHNKPQEGGSWGTFRAPGFTRPLDDDDDLLSDTQTRKRHKGQDGRDDEHQWDPRAGQHNRNGLQVIKVEQSDEEPSIPAPAASNMAPPPSAKRRRIVDGQTSQTSQVSSTPPPTQDDDSAEASARKRGAKKRENLTEDQKRKNHIHSEKKRREIIQQGYADLNKLVPCLVSGKSGLSRSECLQEIGSYLETLCTGNARIMEILEVDENHPELLAVHAEWAAATARIE